MSAQGLGWRGAALVLLVTVLAQSWILDLPFQLDDYLLLPEPLAFFRHVERLEQDDVPAFMCRIPLWLSWALVRAFVSEPLTPLPYHVFGLALQSLVACALARLVARHAPVARGAHAGVVAGALFGASGGALQAISWSAAWSSPLYTLFALVALDLTLAARALAGARAALRLAGALVAIYLAIITKVPALVAAGCALLLLAASAWRARRYVAFLREALVLGLGIGLGLLTRTWFLGTGHLRYEARVEPGLHEFPGIVAQGFRGLAQALYPWNRDPLFAGEEPALARLAGLVSGPLGPSAWLALALLPALVLLAAALAPRTRPWIGALGLTLLAAVVPVGTLYAGQATNFAGREAYLPLALTAALAGVAALALAERSRALGALALLLLGALTADGTRHVAHTERLHAEELRAIASLFETLADQADARLSARRPLVLAIVPDAGFAGIPSLGPMLPRSLRPPFTPSERLDVETFASAADLADYLADQDLSQRDLVLVGPEVDAAWEPLAPDPALPGAANRARRRLRCLSPLRPGLTDGAFPALAFEGASGTWRAPAPIPAHAIGAVALTVQPGAPLSGALLFGDADDDLAIPIDDPGSPGSRLTLAAPARLEQRFGPPVSAITWRGSDPGPVQLELLPRLPILTALSPPPGAELPIPSARTTPPTFTLAPLPGDLRPGSFARLELRFALLGRAASAFSDLPFPAPLALTPTTLHLSATSPTPVTSNTAPWSALFDERILPTIAQGALQGATFHWRITLHHPGGTPAARSPFQMARFVLPDGDTPENP